MLVTSSQNTSDSAICLSRLDPKNRANSRIVDRLQACLQPYLPLRLDGVAGIEAQVQQDLLELRAVPLHVQRRLSQVPLEEAGRVLFQDVEDPEFGLSVCGSSVWLCGSTHTGHCRIGSQSSGLGERARWGRRTCR